MTPAQEPSDTSTPRERLFALHDSTFAVCRDIMRVKNADYTAKSADPYANFRLSEIFGVHPVTGILLRVSDKMQRIRSFVAAGRLEVPNESLEDACDDIVNYMILIKGLIREGT